MMRFLIFVISLFLCVGTGEVLAADQSSTNYQGFQPSFGGTLVSSTSPSYQILGSVSPAVGDPESSNYQTQSGVPTASEASGSSDSGSSGGSGGSGTAGGGGGGSYAALLVAGVAPTGTVVHLSKDGFIVASSTAGFDGQFLILLPQIQPGEYLFSLKATFPNQETRILLFPTNLQPTVLREILGVVLESERTTSSPVSSGKVQPSDVVRQILPAIQDVPIARRSGSKITRPKDPFVSSTSTESQTIYFLEYDEYVSSDDFFSIRGQTVPGAKVDLFVSGEEEIVRTATSSPQGFFSFTVTDPLKSGSYSFIVSVTGPEGVDVQSTQSFSFIKESEKRATNTWLVLIVIGLLSALTGFFLMGKWMWRIRG